MRPPLTVLALLVPACWSSASPVAPAPPTHSAPADTSLDSDLKLLGAYLAHTGEPFTSVEIVGFTAANDIVYRSIICDPDELGGRGPYCTAEVCTGPAREKADCEDVVNETVDAQSGAFDQARVRNMIRAAETARHPVTRGGTEDPSATTVDASGGDLSLRAPAWFGPSPWTVLRASTDPDSGEREGFTTAAITSVLRNDDGTCLAVAGTALQRARYESVVGSVRVAFTTRRCRGQASKP